MLVPKELSPEARELVEKLGPHLYSSRSSAPQGMSDDHEDDHHEDHHGGDTDKGSVFDRLFRKKKK